MLQSGSFGWARDYFLPLPNECFDGTVMYPCSYEDRRCFMLQVLADLRTLEYHDGRWQETETHLLLPEISGHFKAHSARNFMLSLAAEMGIPQDKQDMLGFWNGCGSDAYLRKRQSVVYRIQEKVFQMIRLSPEIFDETEIMQTVESTLAAKGAQKTAIDIQIALLCWSQYNTPQHHAKVQNQVHMEPVASYWRRCPSDSPGSMDVECNSDKEDVQLLRQQHWPSLLNASPEELRWEHELLQMCEVTAQAERSRVEEMQTSRLGEEAGTLQISAKREMCGAIEEHKYVLSHIRGPSGRISRTTLHKAGGCWRKPGKDLKHASFRMSVAENEWGSRCKDCFPQDKEVRAHYAATAFGRVTADEIEHWEVNSEDSEDGSDDGNSTSKASDEDRLEGPTIIGSETCGNECSHEICLGVNCLSNCTGKPGHEGPCFCAEHSTRMVRSQESTDEVWV